MVACSGPFHRAEKFNGAGVYHWSKRFGDGTAAQSANAVAIDGAGNIALTGTFLGAVDFGGGPLTAAGASYGDLFVAQVSPSGAYLWSERYGDGQDQAGIGIGIDTVGDVYVTGNLTGSMDLGTGTLTSAGGVDVLVMKFGP